MEHLSTDRRGFMKAAGVIAVATAASSISVCGAGAQQVSYSGGTEAPKLKAPANACDCHMHIYNANYPVAPSATLKLGVPSYSDTIPVARAYIKAAPQRVVWASDWPHPTEKENPDDAILFDLLAEWAPDAASRTLILVQNPATLYGFPM